MIVGGRYGSMDTQGISYTEKEYDYAVQQGKPVMGFVHGKPNEIAVGKSEIGLEVRVKLDSFRAKVQQKMCRFWTNADELGGAVSRSYVQLLKTHPPAEGWVKARYAKTTEELEKVNQMHEQIRILEQELARLRETSNHIPANLARGIDIVRFEYDFRNQLGDDRPANVREVTWNDVFRVIGQLCMDLPPETAVRSELSRLLISSEAEITDLTFRKIKVQLYALGLIRMEMYMHRQTGNWLPISANASNSASEPVLSWVLTEAGRRALADLLGEKRRQPEPPAAAGM
jgi:hypothetical protein